MNSNITILDLAKFSGISKSTISRYLRGDSVSRMKAEIIEEAIKKTGYIRNNYAQLLRTSKSNFLGVLIPDLDNPFFLTIVKRLDELAYREGKTLIIKTTQSELKRELEAISFIRGFRVEAIFLCRSEMSEIDLEKLNITIPVISIDKLFNNVISIVSNNNKNGYILSKHVFSNVENNVMFFSRQKESNSVLDRIVGYSNYCEEHNKTYLSYRYNRPAGVNFEDLRDYVYRNEVDAIIARNDNEAIKIQSYFNDLFYKGIFKKIKVAGFDNIRLSKNILPRLTTIDQNIEEMCDLAYEKFVTYENVEVRTYIQDSELIIRESTLER
ncbi:MAG: LacI family DNA-binding transcriptional regulator [Tenericutes bacterium]|nr:LacI family DNA-binding transcriptional regulator [Mycoplasmatota bacterium]